MPGHDLRTDALLACVQIGKRLTSTLDTKEILDLIMSKVSKLIQAENWSLLLVEESTGLLKFEVAVGIDMNDVNHIRLKPGQGIAGYVLQTGETLLVGDVRSDPRFYMDVDQNTGFVTQSIVCVPLTVRGQILGVLEVINIEDMDIFKREYLPILNILADYAAIAIDNSRNFTKIRQVSRTDEYTGLPNARYMHEILPGLIDECRRAERNIAVVFVDIDNFKIVVDAFGHLRGSQVLNEIGKTIRSCLSDQDILIKYGGDEFVILLPDRDKNEAQKVIGSVLGTIRETEYLQDEDLPIRLTASFGIAVFPDDAQTKKDLLIKADNLMYQIKMSSKNGMATSENLPR